MSEDPFDDVDPAFLKDLSDIIKNRTLFFIPFFGAFLAFVFAKVDYIKSANFVIWGFIALIFLASVRYISLVTDLLWLIEGSRFVLNLKKSKKTMWDTWEKDKETLVDMLAILPKLAAAESWWFKKLMLVLYLGLFTVLIDMFFGARMNALAVGWMNRLLN